MTRNKAAWLFINSCDATKVVLLERYLWVKFGFDESADLFLEWLAESIENIKDDDIMQTLVVPDDVSSLLPDPED